MAKADLDKIDEAMVALPSRCCLPRKGSAPPEALLPARRVSLTAASIDEGKVPVAADALASYRKRGAE